MGSSARIIRVSRTLLRQCRDHPRQCCNRQPHLLRGFLQKLVCSLVRRPQTFRPKVVAVCTQDLHVQWTLQTGSEAHVSLATGRTTGWPLGYIGDIWRLYRDKWKIKWIPRCPRAAQSSPQCHGEVRVYGLGFRVWGL